MWWWYTIPGLLLTVFALIAGKSGRELKEDIRKRRKYRGY
ncbi:hypothetical protein ES705_35745 [subsurface metagenome]